MKRVIAAVGLALLSVQIFRWPAASLAGEHLPSLQVRRGAVVFHARCAACHGEHLEGVVGPRLAGPGAIVKRKTTGAIFGFVTKNMPYGAPGSLTRNEYAAVVTFILAKNGHATERATLGYAQLLDSKTPI